MHVVILYMCFYTIYGWYVLLTTALALLRLMSTLATMGLRRGTATHTIIHLHLFIRGNFDSAIVCIYLASVRKPEYKRRTHNNKGVNVQILIREAVVDWPKN